MNMKKTMIAVTATLALGLGVYAINAASQSAPEVAIRKNLTERLNNFPKIDEVSKTPMPGLYEVRVHDSEILYTDAEGNFLIQGEIIDTRARRNLTKEREEKLAAIDFGKLPLADAIKIVRGDGKRKMAVFEDPNCGYCKRFEEGLQKVDNVTVYLYLYPILSKDSADKSRNIWCAKDKIKAWQDWMLRNVAPPTADCQADAMQRNLELGRKHRISGTPALIFTNGQRVPGAIGPEQIEKYLSDAGR